MGCVFLFLSPPLQGRKFFALRSSAFGSGSPSPSVTNCSLIFSASSITVSLIFFWLLTPLSLFVCSEESILKDYCLSEAKFLFVFSMRSTSFAWNYTNKINTEIFVKEKKSTYRNLISPIWSCSPKFLLQSVVFPTDLCFDGWQMISSAQIWWAMLLWALNFASSVMVWIWHFLVWALSNWPGNNFIRIQGGWGQQRGKMRE